ATRTGCRLPARDRRDFRCPDPAGLGDVVVAGAPTRRAQDRARSGLGLRLSVSEPEDAIHRVILRPAADNAIPPVRQEPRGFGIAARLFPAPRLLSERQRRSLVAIAVRADGPLVRSHREPARRDPARPYPPLCALCRGDAGGVAGLGEPLSDARARLGSSAPVCAGPRAAVVWADQPHESLCRGPARAAIAAALFRHPEVSAARRGLRPRDELDLSAGAGGELGGTAGRDRGCPVWRHPL